MSQLHWQPAASLPMLQARARLNQQIRAFFQDRQVLEVETPLLCRSTGTDPNLAPITATYNPGPGAADQTLYLQTSPEFAMKRLLASGSGPIFQLCKAFRNGELGARHNPEFSMLEWYRPGYSLAQLMDEVEALVQAVLGPLTCRRLSYRQLFQQYLDIDPHKASSDALAALAAKYVELHGSAPGRDTSLELLYSQVVEPQLQDPVFISEYPASQAALSRVLPDREGRGVAQRFELVIKGMEIANGYDELVDAGEQKMRFTADQHRRRKQGLPVYEADQHLLAALAHGMPPGAGVALGVDRLLMLQTGAATIAEVLAFPYARA